ncbi:Jacalin-type lectin domain-containing protein [Mycena indigotica]|uniref:Jacalin-type lectin domain-containing protein n=1 Tax=Mycena indigotica TaxID=2126181 RepID=A0A8H6S0U4_9AGAR|nr:Jacalin-type lectin domain-containing protein [Mycena indigotica]KAF7289961.1 Jacalin-type lectin domain-containing protein [Mycena indigotica]
MLLSLALVSAFAQWFAKAQTPAPSGQFNVLSMNVAGLPAILNGNGEGNDATKQNNTRLIGTNMAKLNYSVIHVQEDFNYHAYLYSTDTHPFRTATSGGVPFGSGLNTLSNFPWFSDVIRVKWKRCSDASENDCLTPKGFTFMRIRFDVGTYIDFYNLHADAGTEAGDETARAANLQQVADYIDTWSTGNAVLVFGDTNARYTRVGDGIRIFQTQNGMLDGWVESVKGGVYPTLNTSALVCNDGVPTNTSCEVVDKILYRSNKLISLTNHGFSYDTARFLNSTGGMLSDHNPIRVDFDWALAPTWRQSDLQGGPHGDWFNDLPNVPNGAKTKTLTIRGGSRLDSVALTLTNGQSFVHGGTGGTAVSLTLAAGENIIAGTLCWDKFNGDTRNFYASFQTSGGRVLKTGAQTSQCATMTAPTGFSIVSGTPSATNTGPSQAQKKPATRANSPKEYIYMNKKQLYECGQEKGAWETATAHEACEGLHQKGAFITDYEEGVTPSVQQIAMTVLRMGADLQSRDVNMAWCCRAVARLLDEVAKDAAEAMDRKMNRVLEILEETGDNKEGDGGVAETHGDNGTGDVGKGGGDGQGKRDAEGFRMRLQQPEQARKTRDQIEMIGKANEREQQLWIEGAAVEGLSEKEMVEKAKYAIEHAAEDERAPEWVKVLAARRVKNGALLLRMASREATEWVKERMERFSTGMGGTARYRERLYDVVVEFVPKTIAPIGEYTLRELEDNNNMRRNDIGAARFIKPEERHRPGQKSRPHDSGLPQTRGGEQVLSAWHVRGGEEGTGEEDAYRTNEVPQVPEDWHRSRGRDMPSERGHVRKMRREASNGRLHSRGRGEKVRELRGSGRRDGLQDTWGSGPTVPSLRREAEERAGKEPGREIHILPRARRQDDVARGWEEHHRRRV